MLPALLPCSQAPASRGGDVPQSLVTLWGSPFPNPPVLGAEECWEHGPFGKQAAQESTACLPACTAACSCLEQKLLPSPAPRQKRCWVSWQSCPGSRMGFSSPASWVQDRSPYHTPCFHPCSLKRLWHRCWTKGPAAAGTASATTLLLSPPLGHALS